MEDGVKIEDGVGRYKEDELRWAKGLADHFKELVKEANVEQIQEIKSLKATIKELENAIEIIRRENGKRDL